MPITLYLANVVLKGKEGLAFGLLAAALIPGYLLAVYW
jgi:Na+(H+)/acetate symporter ActP